MFLPFIIVIIDGLLLFKVDYLFNNISYFYPMLTISYLSILLLQEPKKKYPLKCFIIGFIYDFFYSSIFLFHSLLFYLLSKINLLILKFLKKNLLTILLICIIDLTLYDFFFFLITSRTFNFSINDYFYKIIHSYPLNILFVFVFFFLVKNKSFKNKM